jgi:hypothetical protein
VGLEPVAVSTQSLQVGWVIIKAVTVYVVYIQLTDMYWLEVTFFAMLFAIGVVGRACFHLVNLVDSFTTVPT